MWYICCLWGFLTLLSVIMWPESEVWVKYFSTFHLLFGLLLQCQQPVGSTLFELINSFQCFPTFGNLTSCKRPWQDRKKNCTAFADLFHQKLQVWAVSPSLSECRLLFPLRFSDWTSTKLTPWPPVMVTLWKHQPQDATYHLQSGWAQPVQCSEKRVWPQKLAAVR